MVKLTTAIAAFLTFAMQAQTAFVTSEMSDYDKEKVCTLPPVFGCYNNGFPECCSDDAIDCPEEEPTCDVPPLPSCENTPNIATSICPNDNDIENQPFTTLCRALKVTGIFDLINVPVKTEDVGTFFAVTDEGWNRAFSQEELENLFNGNIGIDDVPIQGFLFMLFGQKVIFPDELTCGAPLLTSFQESVTFCKSLGETFQVGFGNDLIGASNLPKYTSQVPIITCTGLIYEIDNLILGDFSPPKEEPCPCGGSNEFCNYDGYPDEPENAYCESCPEDECWAGFFPLAMAECEATCFGRTSIPSKAPTTPNVPPTLSPTSNTRNSKKSKKKKSSKSSNRSKQVDQEDSNKM
mmetsp:Transcript_2964/g.3340  ORF Transcript_2964/g.3340 Transcript_2964/m.3340 type:complete len:351 (-) Transcript_2964:279-1331(-)|eukprot:CAMPEP_0171001156 /NCGR_PEP_ID=MMETSP0736-20130129/15281_1 /TAXON_ID=186038 /ORGANISM="Fragilariopsis kerguelensis, Strain L26-C5" /LENGTH=350 /DNA_ID=CAMNT_0011428971 /DNA_START=59 /DNA_END=1111 /DNA_ORIENTATION=-